MTHCLRTLIRQEFVLNTQVMWGHSFAQKTWKATENALCSCVNRAIRWDIQIPIYSAKVLWLGELKGIFSNKWRYKLFSLPRHSERSSSKGSNCSFVVLIHFDPCPKFCEWTGPRALLWGWSALPVYLSARVAGFCSFQPFLSALLVSWGWRSYHWRGEVDSGPPPGKDWENLLKSNSEIFLNKSSGRTGLWAMIRSAWGYD